MSEDKFYQTFLKDCDCTNGGIIIKNGVAVCRWCRIPYAECGVMPYKEEHFKKASKQPSVDFEILKCDCDSLGVHDYTNNGNCPCSRENFKFCKIHSVKRLIDGEVFAIGDEVDGKNNNSPFGVKIEAFHILHEQMFVFYEDTNISLDVLQKVKKPILIFTTEDGVGIYHGDNYYCHVHTETFEFQESQGAQYYASGKAKNVKYFSSKNAAKEYILMNKPCLTLSQVKDAVGYCGGVKNNRVLLDLYNVLTREARQKINNVQ